MPVCPAEPSPWHARGREICADVTFGRADGRDIGTRGQKGCCFEIPETPRKTRIFLIHCFQCVEKLFRVLYFENTNHIFQFRTIPGRVIARFFMIVEFFMIVGILANAQILLKTTAPFLHGVSECPSFALCRPNDSFANPLINKTSTPHPKVQTRTVLAPRCFVSPVLQRPWILFC